MVRDGITCLSKLFGNSNLTPQQLDNNRCLFCSILFYTISFHFCNNLESIFIDGAVELSEGLWGKKHEEGRRRLVIEMVKALLTVS